MVVAKKAAIRKTEKYKALVEALSKDRVAQAAEAKEGELAEAKENVAVEGKENGSVECRGERGRSKDGEVRAFHLGDLWRILP